MLICIILMLINRAYNIYSSYNANKYISFIKESRLSKYQRLLNIATHVYLILENKRVAMY